MITILISLTIAFVIPLLIAPYFMQFLSIAGIVETDHHKKGKPKLPTSGGACVALGILGGLLSYIGINTFVYGAQPDLIYILAAISSILIIMFMGFLDDLNIKPKAVISGDKLRIRVGFPKWSKPLLTLPAAVPLMAVNAGVAMMSIPFIGTINFGLFYPLLLIPIMVVVLSNITNLLGGFNGSESSMGIVYLFGLGLYGLLSGSRGTIMFLSAFAALIGFIKYNWFPAKILPGSSLKYLLGAVVATGAIIGDMEGVVAIVMLPFVIEFFLKARSRFRASCLGELRRDGRLSPPYERRVYSWTHLIMNAKKLTEKQVTVSLALIQILFSIIPFLGII